MKSFANKHQNIVLVKNQPQKEKGNDAFGSNGKIPTPG
jgi:hypothetical protein